MEKILLVLPTLSMRQLYHELLIAPQYEILCVDSLAKALGFMTVDDFGFVVLFSESKGDVELFSKIRRKKENWKKTRLLVLRSDDVSKNTAFIKKAILGECEK